MRPTQRQKAIKLAILALKKERQLLAPDASYHDIWGSDHPAAINASLKRAQLADAIRELEKILEETVT